MIIAGTVPIESLDLVEGEVESLGNRIRVAGREIPVSMGTTALAAAAAQTLGFLDERKPQLITAGDLGEGSGSLDIYRRLREVDDEVLVIHYIKPKIDEIRRIDTSGKVVADAGGMYAAKAAGIGPEFHLFLPDPGELAFLADEKAYHPAYVRRFIAEVDEEEVPSLVRRAYEGNQVPDHLVVKGGRDYVVHSGEVVEIVDEPLVEAMECIGGTGDTLTGIVAGLIAAGFETEEACVIGCRVNRRVGEIVKATPATRIHELIEAIPEALREELKD
ncbi:NAD(P)H-hydrate dehydratase [Methanopyrus sp. KOL6]|uniref:NAD(P)H-hydrate dehydratase n=1 Tax=Methanopyrus sp. KOL6 TaxID=1937004 RepID=UPI000B4BDC04|nr:NAD(P)H-hydrate dehydratase [Methanopyrus sp. KOL6]